MNRFLTALLVLAILAPLGCAKAPILKRTAPGYFEGFDHLPAGEARLIVYRGGKWIADGTREVVTVEDCKFEIGVRQFAVCKVSPGRADVVLIRAIDTVNVPDGEWACVTLYMNALIIFHTEKTDCSTLKKELRPQRQVWTTQIPRSEISN